MITKRPRGTNDLLPAQTSRWQWVEEMVRKTSSSYGYQEIRTPMFEHTELFERGIGEATDIVEKEMYTFSDRGDRSITLRPEGTAPVVRAFLENKLYAQPLPAKLFYMGPMFRYERPQAGRYRQHTQFGVEALGSADPALDLEMITLPISVYQACGLEGFSVNINSIGCPQCRPAYREVLLQALRSVEDELCGSCRSRMERNPLRVLDCKVPNCRAATANVPAMVESLCGDCGDHFSVLTTLLDRLDIAYVNNPRLVRGFDYYTKTVFELTVPSLGAQDAVGGGGRYDGLVEECGGPSLPGVGFAVGIERLLLALEQQGNQDFPQSRLDGFVVHFGGATKSEAVALVHELRRSGLQIEMDYQDRSLKAQMKAANRLGVRWVAILGGDEWERRVLNVRWMDEGSASEVSLDRAAEVLLRAKEEQD